ncbi:hypothetical protein HAX54_002730, partial [Datura stramonium]|nr:hypothetical protein [Datura stramonium]
NGLGTTTIGYSPIGSDKTLVLFDGGFRPLICSCVTSAIYGSGPTTRHFVAGGWTVAPVYCYSSAGQRRSVDLILWLASAPL